MTFSINSHAGEEEKGVSRPRNRETTQKKKEKRRSGAEVL